MTIHCNIIMNGHKNTVLQVKGNLSSDGEKTQILEWRELRLGDGAVAKSVRIDSIIYSFERDSYCSLYWWMGEYSSEFILPLGGRGKLDFESLQSLSSPTKCQGLVLESFGKDLEQFLLMINMTKS